MYKASISNLRNYLLENWWGYGKLFSACIIVIQTLLSPTTSFSPLTRSTQSYDNFLYAMIFAWEQEKEQLERFQSSR